MMTRQFFHVTAEYVVAAVEAVAIKNGADEQFVQDFCDIPQDHAASALSAAVDLGLLRRDSTSFFPNSPLTRFASTSNERQKAALLRIVLEDYEPFVVFRERLRASGNVETAARQTKAMLVINLNFHHVKDTLVSLGTYANALRAEAGGRIVAVEDLEMQHLIELEQACKDSSAAEAFVRNELRNAADNVSRSTILIPLSNAIRKAQAGNAVEAITEAGNAVESYLAELANRKGVNLVGKSGIGQKLDAFRTGNVLPKKIVEAAKYLAQVRNAADHGTDTEINANWSIQSSTGVNYVRVSCAFIAASYERELGAPFIV